MPRAARPDAAGVALVEVAALGAEAGVVAAAVEVGAAAAEAADLVVAAVDFARSPLKPIGSPPVLACAWCTVECGDLRAARL